VRSYRTYARIRSLTTGTFNRVVKDRIALRLSGANPVQFEASCVGAGLNPKANRRLAQHTRQHPTVPETLQTYRAAQNPVNAHIPQNFHAISTTGRLLLSFSCGDGHSCPSVERSSISLQRGLNRTQRYVSSAQSRARNSAGFISKAAHNFSGTRKQKTQKLKKELLEVLTLKVPFRNR
jgi:hypothetical protein